MLLFTNIDINLFRFYFKIFMRVNLFINLVMYSFFATEIYKTTCAMLITKVKIILKYGMLY